MFGRLKMPFRYAWNLKRFLQQPLSPEECRRRIAQQLRNRGESFLRILERGIFANPRSPYGKLLRHAGCEFGDVAHLIRREGVEETLTRLYHAGVYVTLDEFKGRRPIQRSGLQFSAQPHDFDNPLLAKDYEARTGGSRSTGNRVIIDFDLLAHEAAYYYFSLLALKVTSRPVGMWYPVLPGVAGMKLALRYAKLGKRVEKWFSQNELVMKPGSSKHFLFTNYAVYGSRLWGNPIAAPEHIPLAQASRVARWLAAKKEQRTPALFYTYPSSAARVCLATKELGLDITGTFFYLGGEPCTPEKAQVVAETGSRATSYYSMAEVGSIGMACAAPVALDDVHLFTDKLAVIQQDKPVGTDGVSIGALFHTTLLPSCPKLMLNVDSGDYGVLEKRPCGCLLEEVGFQQHLHSIRSYEKLTSEGVTFLGGDLVTLVEKVLPAQFGGRPTDYQFIEEEERGVPKVSILVNPQIGEIDEVRLVATVLQTLRVNSSAGRMMADHWREGQTLRVIRHEPYTTNAAKILPLHILQKR
jgi:hypothetical protein